MQPLRATVAPFESVSVMPTAGQLTDSIKVTFQVRKREFTRRLVESFFAGFAGCAESEHARLDGLISLQPIDRKSTRLNSSHGYISYAVFCLKKKKKKK